MPVKEVLCHIIELVLKFVLLIQEAKGLLEATGYLSVGAYQKTLLIWSLALQLSVMD